MTDPHELDEAGLHKAVRQAISRGWPTWADHQEYMSAWVADVIRAYLAAARREPACPFCGGGLDTHAPLGNGMDECPEETNTKETE